MIRYKVVIKSRKSAIVSSPKYCKNYIKNKVVKANKGTLGIFCFKTLMDAKEFYDKKVDIILKVKPIGKGKRPKLIAINTANLKSFYDKKCNYTNSCASGTICYPAVKVLE